MKRKLNKKIACTHCNFDGEIEFYKITGKDKKHLSDTVRGRGLILSACTKCGFCGDSKG